MVAATKEDIAKLETKIAENKMDTTKRFFEFFAAVMLAITSLYFKK